MTKYKVSSDFSSNRYPDKEFNLKVDSIVTSMTGNEHFPTPSPTPVVLKECNDRFSAALVKMEDGNKQDTAIKNKIREEEEGLIQQLALYVQATSGGDEAIIRSSGFEVNKKAAPVGQLAKPTNLKVKAAENKGSLLITWDPVEHASFYEFKYTDAPSSSTSVWNTMTTTKHKMLIADLTSGKQYAFKVAGAGADASRVWSDEVNSFVL
jgi:hypothetical protein